MGMGFQIGTLGNFDSKSVPSQFDSRWEFRVGLVVVVIVAEVGEVSLLGPQFLGYFDCLIKVKVVWVGP
jgi:hypothetical protein